MNAIAAADAAPALEVRDLWGGYRETTVLRGVTVVVPRASVVALIGPNGAGKSTLLRTISGTLRSSRGSVALGGQDVTRWPAYKRFAAGLCHVPEGRGIFRSLTVRENLVMQAPTRDTNAAIELAAEAFPILGQRMDQVAGTLSGGQQQMLAMAAAYVRSPSLILVDEASLGLAPNIVDEIFAFLERRRAEGASLLIVDQFVHRALRMATRAYVLLHGSIVVEGAPGELLEGNVFEQYLGHGVR